jgi:cytochrome c oxidase assembly factor CtaG
VDPIIAAALGSWSFPPGLVVVVLVTFSVYARGWQHLHRQMPLRFGTWRAAAFAAGLLTLFVALASPLDAFGGLLLQVHMLQHLLLMMVVPPLIWLGAPAAPLLRGLPPALVKHGLGPFLAWPALRRFGRRLTHPVVCWLSFVAATWLWHVPALYESALRSPAWHQVEHFCFLATALLFWWPVIQPWPSTAQWPRWALIPYLLFADIQNTMFSAWFAFSERLIYPTYAAVPRLWGITVLDDQTTAGAIMWVPGSLAFLIPLGWVIVQWLGAPSAARELAWRASGRSHRPAQPRQSPPRGLQTLTGEPLQRACSDSAVEFDSTAMRWHEPPRGFERLSSFPGDRGDTPATTLSALPPRGALPITDTTRPPLDLLVLPVVGPVLRARSFRRALQMVMLLLALAVVVDGLSGPQMGPMNLAGVLPWTYWRGLSVIALLVAGNVFCMACPFMLPRDLGRRWLAARWRFPKALRSKWLAVGLVLLYLWAYEAFSLWDSPRATAWIVMGYFVAAFVVDGLFRGASFCKYVCPIGQFQFIQSLVSPLQVRVRDADVCRRCTTYDCIRGNARQRGCELQLFQPKKVGNLDCTFCLDCVHACPHANVGVLAVAPGSDLVADPYRSSVRRFSRRPDVAALALVLVFGAFANAGAMVGPVRRAQQWLAVRLSASITLPLTACLLVSLVVVPGLAVGLCGWSGRRLGGVRVPAGELICRFALSLLPIGLSMWVAHFAFHLLAGWRTALPVAQRVLADRGVALLGEPSWGLSAAGPAPEWLLPLQLLLLGMGLLLTLYVDWRVASSYVSRVSAAVGLMMPWASLAVTLYAAGLWIVSQPMQMRGMMMH